MMEKNRNTKLDNILQWRTESNRQNLWISFERKMTTGRIVMFSNVRVIRLIETVEKLENSEKFYAILLNFNEFDDFLELSPHLMLWLRTHYTLNSTQNRHKHSLLCLNNSPIHFHTWEWPQSQRTHRKLFKVAIWHKFDDFLFLFEMRAIVWSRGEIWWTQPPGYMDLPCTGGYIIIRL